MGTAGQISYMIHFWHPCWPGPASSDRRLNKCFLTLICILIFLLTFFYVGLRGMNIADPHWSERGVCQERCSCLDSIISISHNSRDWWKVILLSLINLSTSENPRKENPVQGLQSKWKHLGAGTGSLGIFPGTCVQHWHDLLGGARQVEQTNNPMTLIPLT